MILADLPGWFTLEFSVFFVAGLIVLGGAFAVISARNPVHAALGLVATLFGVAVLFLNQNAQLLAAVQVIVYTGAIVVLILFVLMLLGIDRDEDIYDEPLLGQRTFGVIIFGALFLIIFGLFTLSGTRIVTGQPNCVNGKVVEQGDPYAPSECVPVDPTIATNGDRANINQIGRTLFTDFAFAFEITAGLLTIAVVGAVVLARKSKDVQQIPPPEDMDYENLIGLDEESAH